MASGPGERIFGSWPRWNGLAACPPCRAAGPARRRRKQTCAGGRLDRRFGIPTSSRSLGYLPDGFSGHSYRGYMLSAVTWRRERAKPARILIAAIVGKPPMRQLIRQAKVLLMEKNPDCTGATRRIRTDD